MDAPTTTTTGLATITRGAIAVATTMSAGRRGRHKNKKATGSLSVLQNTIAEAGLSNAGEQRHRH
jgi:hypothetical protein